MVKKEMKPYLKEAKRILKEESDYLIPSNSNVYSKLMDDLARPFKKNKIDAVAAIDMKGLMYGPVIANKLKTSFIPILKGDKIIRRDLVIKSHFTDYSGKRKSIEIIKKAVKKGSKILLVDDWFESGNTGRAAIKLIGSLVGEIAGVSIIFNQLKEQDELFFSKYNFHYLIKLERKNDKK